MVALLVIVETAQVPSSWLASPSGAGRMDTGSRSGVLPSLFLMTVLLFLLPTFLVGFRTPCTKN